MAIIYVFIEGGEDKSQHTFWEYINAYVYSSALTIVPVGGVSNILSKISDYPIDNKNDIVILVVDNPEDNKKVGNDIREIIRYTNKHSNTYLFDEVCFEDTFLQFTYFKEWLYSLEYRNTDYKYSDEQILLEEYLNYRDDWRMSDVLYTFLEERTHKKGMCNTIEELAYQVLNYLTYYRQEFGITKGCLGMCWICDCNNKAICRNYYNNGVYCRKIQDTEHICGLMSNKKDTKSKVVELFNHTIVSKKMRIAKNYFLNKGYTVAKHL